MWISDTFIYRRQNEQVVVLAIIELEAISKPIVFISCIQSIIKISLYVYHKNSQRAKEKIFTRKINYKILKLT